MREVFTLTGDRPRVEIYRGQRVATNLQPSVRADVPAADDEVQDLVHIIRQVAGAATTAGKGWIWGTPVEFLLCIRTGGYWGRRDVTSGSHLFG
ncbi:P-II family nitrogen regulator [Amycolatopsis acidiphila]|uniref:P-II family nitrogen regulator n=1 Tax=Amycolatopsis acidiphila TaxID=715473 RepID=UPI001E5D8D7E|nr:P-II family nitrogen regulator [Amycolatopsis acidiphila]